MYMYHAIFFQVDFRYWGLQSKVERFIHDYGLRRVMLRAHRQAWAWQDEWVGLTMDDIRRLERETQVCDLHELKWIRVHVHVCPIHAQLTCCSILYVSYTIYVHIIRYNWIFRHEKIF